MIRQSGMVSWVRVWQKNYDLHVCVSFRSCMSRILICKASNWEVGLSVSQYFRFALDLIWLMNNVISVKISQVILFSLTVMTIRSTWTILVCYTDFLRKMIKIVCIWSVFCRKSVFYFWACLKNTCLKFLPQLILSLLLFFDKQNLSTWE